MAKNEDDEGPTEAVYDTGSGRWFVLTRSGAEWTLMAGPYQTNAAMERWMDSYEAPPGVDHVQSVRCEGTWRDAIPHAEQAIAAIKRQMGTARS